MKLKYQVFGADAVTGKDRRVVVEADSQEEAAHLANELGIFVSSTEAWREPTLRPPLIVNREPAFSDQTQRTIVGMAVVVSALLLIVFICAGILHTSPESTAKTKGDDDRAMAITMAQGFVRDKLKSPSSASFPWGFNEYSVESTGPAHWTVSGYVNAKNSFGTEIRTRWSVEMDRVANGGWQLKEIDIHE